MKNTVMQVIKNELKQNGLITDESELQRSGHLQSKKSSDNIIEKLNNLIVNQENDQQPQQNIQQELVIESSYQCEQQKIDEKIFEEKQVSHNLNELNQQKPSNSQNVYIKSDRNSSENNKDLKAQNMVAVHGFSLINQPLEPSQNNREIQDSILDEINQDILQKQEIEENQKINQNLDKSNQDQQIQSEEEIDEIDKRFDILETLGQGTYGVVYKAFDKQLNRLVALKKTIFLRPDEGIPSYALREICILKQLNHAAIIRLLDVVSDGLKGKKLYLVFEYCNMDIYNYMHKGKKSFNHNEIRKIFWQIVKAMNYCHQKKIMHRDIKTSNILISDDCKTVKIADFGLARTYDLPLKTYTHEVVTIWYRAPEILLGQNQYGTAIDVWALGCVFYELAHKKPLFSARTEIEQLMKIFKLLGTPHENNWQGSSQLPEMKQTFPKFIVKDLVSLAEICPQFKDDYLALDLLSQMIQLEPSKRISTKGIINHPYFTDYKRIKVESKIPLAKLVKKNTDKENKAPKKSNADQISEQIEQSHQEKNIQQQKHDNLQKQKIPKVKRSEKQEQKNKKTKKLAQKQFDSDKKKQEQMILDDIKSPFDQNIVIARETSEESEKQITKIFQEQALII